MKATAGYTLIELVVAMAAMSMLSLLILQALNLAHRSWDRGTDIAERLDAVATVQQSLRRSLSQLLPLQDAQACGGDSQAVNFVARSPVAAIAGGTARYRLGVVDSGGGHALAIDWCGYDAASSACAPEKLRHEEVIAGLDSASLQYFRDGSWSSSWADCANPPSLIRVAVQFPQKDRRVWPELTIAPRYGAAADCRFDLVSMKCSRA